MSTRIEPGVLLLSRRRLLVGCFGTRRKLAPQIRVNDNTPRRSPGVNPRRGEPCSLDFRIVRNNLGLGSHRARIGDGADGELPLEESNFDYLIQSRSCWPSCWQAG